MGKYKIDFSEHTLTIDKSENATIYRFKKGDSSFHSVYLINSCGIMAVTGDIGNWIFCREFHPKAGKNNYASRSYMDEKLRISSEQKSEKYDSEEALKEISKFKEEFESYYGRRMNKTEKEWVNDLVKSTDNEFEYQAIAYLQKPDTIDYDYIPSGKIRIPWLDHIYDAFDAMCDFLSKQELQAAKNL